MMMHIRSPFSDAIPKALRILVREMMGEEVPQIPHRPSRAFWIRIDAHDLHVPPRVRV